MRLCLVLMIFLLALVACSSQSSKSGAAIDFTGESGSGPFPGSSQREEAFRFPESLELTPAQIKSEWGGRDPRLAVPRDFFDDMNVRRIVTVATFTVDELGVDERRSAAHLQEIASLIGKHDVVAVLGVRNASGANQLMDVLIDNKQPWGGLYPANNGDGEFSEAPLFLWKRDRLRLTHAGGYIDSTLARDPYWAAFEVKVEAPGAFDFVLLSAHARPEQADEVRRLDQIARNLRHQLSTETGASSLGMNEPEADILLAGTFHAGVQPRGVGTDLSDSVFLELFGYTYAGPQPLPAKAVVQWPTITLGSRASDNILWWAASDEDFAQVRGMDYVSRPRVSKHQPVWAGFFLDQDSN